MQGGTLAGECANVADRTIWVIWIWAEIWMLLCDMTLSVWPFLFTAFQCSGCDRSHVSISYFLRTWPKPPS